MKRDEYAAALRKLHLDPKGLANLLGITDRTCRRYLSQDRIPPPTRKLIRLMLRKQVDIDDVRRA